MYVETHTQYALTKDALLSEHDPTQRNPLHATTRPLQAHEQARAQLASRIPAHKAHTHCFE